VKSGLGILCVLIFLGATMGIAGVDETSSLRLLWHDEFDGPAGQLPDSQRWQFDIGTDWGNLQLEFDTDRPSNVSLDGQGNLAIVARQEEFEGQRYTAGRIKTKDLFEPTHGRIEARIHLPVGQGIWPAFWMLGANLDQVGWPQCGEIDIMEYRGHEPHVLHGTIHGPGYAGDDALGNKTILEEGGFHLGFHVFAIEWRENSIEWFLDGELYHQVRAEDLPPDTEWVYDAPFFLLLNIAVGGRWPGSPDEHTKFPQTMLIDWVRVYELAS